MAEAVFLYYISIHALLAESDYSLEVQYYVSYISIHALLAESDKDVKYKRDQTILFLSTLSLRRATGTMVAPIAPTYISIHALLAESDDKMNKLAE